MRRTASGRADAGSSTNARTAPSIRRSTAILRGDEHLAFFGGERVRRERPPFPAMAGSVRAERRQEECLRPHDGGCCAGRLRHLRGGPRGGQRLPDVLLREVAVDGG